MIGHLVRVLWSLFRLGALRLSVSDTLLIFVGIPAVLVLVIAGLALAGKRGGHGAKRYRPGRPYDFTPVWFLAAPEQLADPTGTTLPAGAPVPALAGKTEIARKRGGATGGASDRW